MAGPRGATGLVGRSGPTGATGAAGATILGTYETYAQFIAEHPTGTAGDAYLVDGELYVWDATAGAWADMGSLIGPTGAAGATILDSYETYAQFIAEHPTGTEGDAYLVDGELYVWEEPEGEWVDMGSLIGPTGPAGPAGPEGPQGLDGVDGLIGEINGAVETAAELPETGIEQGTIYYVEDEGALYVWDAATGEWIELSVAQGPRGATGPMGADGIVGTIQGVVPSATDLPQTGVEQGAIYYVEDEGTLYVWDETEGWTELSVVQGPRGVTGPTGPTGPTGAMGADGIIGQIDGVVETTAQLPETGADQGTIYYVEENGTLYVWDETAGAWIELSVAQGPRGATGPMGADGLIGPIQGVVNSVGELPTTGIDQGTIYYVVDDGLYVWDEDLGWTALGVAQGPRGVAGPVGATGPTGPTGPAASSYMIIPFASAEAPLTHATNGNPTAVSLLGFGYGDRRDFGLLTASDYSIPIEPSNYSFTLTGNSTRQMAFSLPFDVRIRSLYITVGNYGTFNTDYAVFPYVQLYRAEAGTNNFVRIEDAFAIPEQGIGPGTSVPADTMRSAQKTGLDILLRAGTRIGIGAMMQIPGHSGGAENYWLYFTGGIGMTYEPMT